MITIPEEVLSVKCPLCKKEFSTNFCPNCGIPYSTNINMRPEYKSFNEFQLCDKCYTKNPFHAKYCRNCGEDISLHAKDKYEHGWIDLGLSVLWSTNSINGYFQWNNTRNYFRKDEVFTHLINEYKKANKEDVATYIWGKKWRTPTKAEFEELIEKCKWEKTLIPNTTERALKITGPNNNFIYFPISRVSYWTATKATDEKAYFYMFVNRANGLIYRDSELNLSWLSTPYTPEGHHFRMGYNHILQMIRPVADKKWQGEL